RRRQLQRSRQARRDRRRHQVLGVRRQLMVDSRQSTAPESAACGDRPAQSSGAGLRTLDVRARRLRSCRLSTVDGRLSSSGFTLIELMIVLVLLGLVMAVAVRGIRSLAKSDMRTSAVKMAGA